MYPRLHSAIALFAISGLAACGGATVRMLDPDIPEPLVTQIPISVVARFPDSFDSFVHEEQVIGKEKWTIDLGHSNRILFTQLFGSMFGEFSVIDNETDPRDLPIDALIEPSIDAFEFSVPSQSQTDDFAVWIRYRIKIYDSSGTQIANWPIAAYGKSQTAGIGKNEALQRAAVLAMRDAAALIIMQMDRSTGISKLGQAAAAPEPPPAGEEPGQVQLQTTAAEERPDDTG